MDVGETPSPESSNFKSLEDMKPNGHAASGKDNAAFESDDQHTPPPSYEETVIPMSKELEAEEDVDPWDLVMPPDSGKPWKGMVCKLQTSVFISDGISDML